MKKTLATLLLALGAFALQPAQAQLEHSYNFFDFGYERSSFQGAGRDLIDSGHGVAVDFSVSPREHLLFAAEYHYSRPENAIGEGINAHDLKFGVGGYLPIGTSISLYALAGARHLKAETGVREFDPSDWGFFAEPGVRVNLTGNLEVYAAYEYTSIFNDPLHAGKVGGILNFTETLGLEVFGRFDETWVHSYGAGIRIGW